jgi:membrane-bound lytic murein transglycosylase D
VGRIGKLAMVLVFIPALLAGQERSPNVSGADPDDNRNHPESRLLESDRRVEADGAGPGDLSTTDGAKLLELLRPRIARAVELEFASVTNIESTPSATPDAGHRWDFLAGQTVLDIMPYEREAVRSYLTFFEGRGKQILHRWLKRSGRFKTIILETLEQEGMPKDLLYVAMIESGFSNFAVSHASAVGLWQFIETTGVEMGLEINRWVDQRRDPIKSTKVACKYLRMLHEKFGTWPLALAAYNGGPGLVAREVRRWNSNDFWFIERHRGLYDETRRYGPKIMAAVLVSRNVDRFDLSGIKPDPPFVFDLVEVPGGIGLKRLALAAGATLAELERLNPELLRRQTPPNVGEYDLRIPAGSAEKFVAKFDGYQKGGETTLRVRFGDTLASIARRYGLAPRVLRVANGMGMRTRVSYGTDILVPGGARLKQTGPTRTKKSAVIVPADSFRVDGAHHYIYRVIRGDSLAALASALELEASEIALWNDLDVGAKLQSGMFLQVFVSKVDATEGVALLPVTDFKLVPVGTPAFKKLASRSKSGRGRRVHRVKQGQSLWTISRKFRVTVKDLKRWNRSLRKSILLQPGQKIVVYPGKSSGKKKRRSRKKSRR